jgi:cold shock CspA family protein
MDNGFPHAGRIKNWLADRGFGFIERDDGQPDVHSVAQRCGVEPVHGLRVFFDMERDALGRYRARAVKLAS